MSQFDFPRINFAGQAKINPATANNNMWLPLVLFDSIQVKSIIPPRIYCSEDLLYSIAIKAIHLPKGCEVKTDETGADYFEISSVHTSELFKKWAMFPLGSSPIDSDFHTIYPFIRTHRGNEPLAGKIPGSWNYYGGMDFEFDQTKVKAVEILDSNFQVKKYISTSIDSPDSIRKILNSSLDLKNERGQNTAVMIDVIPGLSFYSQVFCDFFRMRHDDTTLFSGKPEKASLRFLNPARIINQKDALGSSGTFYCVIPIEQLKESEAFSITDFFKEFATKKKQLQGICFRYNLFEVEENLEPDYNNNTILSNPAYAKIIGSLTPWYDNEFKSMPMGRFMVSQSTFLPFKSLGSFVFEIDTERKVIMLDMIGSIPETKDLQSNQYKTFELGTLSFVLETENKNIEIGTLTIDDETFSRERLTHSGGLIEMPLTETKDITESKLLIYGSAQKDETGKAIIPLLMSENEWQLGLDNAGLYINELDDAKDGYRSYSHHKESCKVFVYRYGKPIDYSIPMFIKSFKIKSSLASADIEPFLLTDHFISGTELHFPTSEAGNHMYILYPGVNDANLNYPIPDIIKTGFLLNLRILPKHDYGKYLDPSHPDYPAPITFEIIYEELLSIFDLIYPYSSIITPFTEEYFTKGWKYIKNRLQPENWNSYKYMPSSRDMSEDLYKLICKWGESFD